MTTLSQFPPPPSLPRQYTTTTPDNREDVPNEWMQYGACTSADPEAWFPEVGGRSTAAKDVCNSCDVREQCLEYALTNREHYGLWGGLTERERQKILKKRDAA